MAAIRIRENYSISDNQFVGTHSFVNYNDSSGNLIPVPIYEANSIYGLNQLVGYAKFINRDYGYVCYRGECRLHPTLIPSLYRHSTKLTNANNKIVEHINKIRKDSALRTELNLDDLDEYQEKCVVEGMLQHYGLPTRFIDVVDNLWVALWMGQYERTPTKNIKTKNNYVHYFKRELPNIELARIAIKIHEQWTKLASYPSSFFPLSDIAPIIDGVYPNGIKESNLYQYIILLAIPYSDKSVSKGISVSKTHVLVDLRQALPSIFLRPHAQHGLVVKKRIEKPKSIEQYDMATEVIGIVRIRLDKATNWLGEGVLLTQENLFPTPAFDIGYDILLSRTDLFTKQEYSITRYY